VVGKEWFPRKGSRPPTDIILRRRVRLRFTRGEETGVPERWPTHDSVHSDDRDMFRPPNKRNPNLPTIPRGTPQAPHKGVGPPPRRAGTAPVSMQGTTPIRLRLWESPSIPHPVARTRLTD